MDVFFLHLQYRVDLRLETDFDLLPGDHQHFTFFGFTTPGHYEFEFT